MRVPEDSKAGSNSQAEHRELRAEQSPTVNPPPPDEGIGLIPDCAPFCPLTTDLLPPDWPAGRGGGAQIRTTLWGGGSVPACPQLLPLDGADLPAQVQPRVHHAGGEAQRGGQRGVRRGRALGGGGGEERVAAGGRAAIQPRLGRGGEEGAGDCGRSCPSAGFLHRKGMKKALNGSVWAAIAFFEPPPFR